MRWTDGNAAGITNMIVAGIGLIIAVIGVVAAYYSYNISKINSKLIYNYETVEIISDTKDGMSIAREPHKNYAVFGFDLWIKIKEHSGLISDMYL